MRPLEVAVAAVLLPYLLHVLSPSRGESAVLGIVPFIAAALIVWHLLVEAYRWQMLPIYLVALASLVYECTRLTLGYRAPYLAGLAALLLVGVAIFLATALPVFALPSLTGPHRVGTEIRYLRDETRADPFSDVADRRRELMVQIWYPTEASTQAALAPYRDPRTTTFRDSRFALVQTHSMLRAPLSSSRGRYPVLLYAPSWSGVRTENTFLAEEMASHGYIVVGMDHPYSSSVTVFPDGRIARRKFVGEEDYGSQAAFDAFLATANQQVAIRTDDARFVLNTLEHMNAADPQGLFTGRLDLDRVGIFGYSTGGTVAAQACWLDRRFKAGLDLGGMVAGESATQGTSAPFFFVFEALYEDPPYAPQIDISALAPDRRREVEFSRSQFSLMRQSLAKSGGYWMVIKGIRHRDFSDAPFFSPLQFIRTDPERIAGIISRYLRAFFDKQLSGLEQPLLDSPSPGIPEVRLQVWLAPPTDRPIPDQGKRSEN
jgi:dienelactone hydrolase